MQFILCFWNDSGTLISLVIQKCTNLKTQHISFILFFRRHSLCMLIFFCFPPLKFAIHFFLKTVSPLCKERKIFRLKKSVFTTSDLVHRRDLIQSYFYTFVKNQFRYIWTLFFSIDLCISFFPDTSLFWLV